MTIKLNNIIIQQYRIVWQNTNFILCQINVIGKYIIKRIILYYIPKHINFKLNNCTDFTHLPKLKVGFIQLNSN